MNERLDEPDGVDVEELEDRAVRKNPCDLCGSTPTAEYLGGGKVRLLCEDPCCPGYDPDCGEYSWEVRLT